MEAIEKARRQNSKEPGALYGGSRVTRPGVPPVSNHFKLQFQPDSLLHQLLLQSNVPEYIHKLYVCACVKIFFYPFLVIHRALATSCQMKVVKKQKWHAKRSERSILVEISADSCMGATEQKVIFHGCTRQGKETIQSLIDDSLQDFGTHFDFFSLKRLLSTFKTGFSSVVWDMFTRREEV